MTERHLVNDSRVEAGRVLVQPACASTFEVPDPTRFTWLYALTACPACRVVQAARIVTINAGEGLA